MRAGEFPARVVDWKCRKSADKAQNPPRYYFLKGPRKGQAGEAPA